MISEYSLPEIDATIELELLPAKIAARKRKLADLVIDLEAARGHPFVTGQEIERLLQDVAVHLAMLEGYQRRLAEARTRAQPGVSVDVLRQAQDGRGPE